MISNYLKVGEKNAIKADELCSLTGHDRRSVLKAIERERSQGTLICASKAGYFLPASQEDVSAFYERYTRYARKMLYTARHFKSHLQIPEGQGDLFG